MNSEDTVIRATWMGCKIHCQKTDRKYRNQRGVHISTVPRGTNDLHRFWWDIKEITLILINMHPDVEQVIIPGGTFGGSVSVIAGVPPSGQISTAQVAHGSRGPIINWTLGDPADIHEIVIVRKRYLIENETDTPQPFETPDDVSAVDRNWGWHCRRRYYNRRTRWTPPKLSFKILLSFKM